MIKVGFVGWRGMVGSVLMERMIEEKDFTGFEPDFFSTSQVGLDGPDVGGKVLPLKDAKNIEELKKMDIIVTCQGGDYTNEVFPLIKQAGWQGYWVDASSALRMVEESIIALDPVNRSVIDNALAAGQKCFVGGNCTVSLMLMAINGLFDNDCVEWISTMTYQAASGAGAKNMQELVAQMSQIGDVAKPILANSSATALGLEKRVTEALAEKEFPIANFGVPLAASLIPWIDKRMENGQTKEEWKADSETNKILQKEERIPVDGLCVRVSSLRCHSQGLTIKLRKDIPLDKIEQMIAAGNEWVKVIPNEKEITLQELTPAKVSGSLTIPIGRIRKMAIGPEYLTAFTVGDQLLWGAAEPIRRILRIIIDFLGVSG
jgi:aspartate-semialdehyde dehydrogenase